MIRKQGFTRRWAHGFTFIEMIVAVTIFAIIAVSIYSTFRAGVRLWSGVSPIINDKQSLRFFFNTISRDLKSSLAYSKEGVNFEGENKKMSFITVIETSGQGPASTRMELARVIYKLDGASGSVKRGVATKLEGLSEDYAKFSNILNGIDDKDSGFEYCYKIGSSPTEYEYGWKDEWDEKDRDSGKIPRGIRINIGDKSKVIFVPTGRLGGEDAF